MRNQKSNECPPLGIKVAFTNGAFRYFPNALDFYVSKIESMTWIELKDESGCTIAALFAPNVFFVEKRGSNSRRIGKE